VTRLTETWSAEAAAFMTRDLSQADYVKRWRPATLRVRE